MQPLVRELRSYKPTQCSLKKTQRIWTQRCTEGRSCESTGRTPLMSQGMPEVTRSWARCMEWIISHHPWREPSLPTPWFWTFSLQNCETTYLYYLNYSICGTSSSHNKLIQAWKSEIWPWKMEPKGLFEKQYSKMIESMDYSTEPSALEWPSFAIYQLWERTQVSVNHLASVSSL